MKVGDEVIVCHLEPGDLFREISSEKLFIFSSMGGRMCEVKEQNTGKLFAWPSASKVILVRRFTE